MTKIQKRPKKLRLCVKMAIITPPPQQNAHIYYYTPLPLNLANKQASKQQQALLLSVLTIAPFQRFGLYSTRAILEPRWWPCQIQVLSQKLTSGAPGWGRQVGKVPNLRILCPKTAFLGPKLPRNPLKTAKRKRWLQSTCTLIAPWKRALCCPLAPRYVRETAQKWLKVAQIARSVCQTCPKPRTGRILGYVAQNRIPRAPSPPATPHFLWFPNLKLAQPDA